MYHWLVRRKMRQTFSRLSSDDWSPALEVMDQGVRQVVPGGLAVSGVQRSRTEVAAWCARMSRLYPGLRFEVVSVSSSGPPWDTTVAVEFVAHVSPAAGEPYRNPSVRVFTLRWGRVTHIREYFDVALVARGLERIAAAGVDEAAAEPIGA